MSQYFKKEERPLIVLQNCDAMEMYSSHDNHRIYKTIFTQSLNNSETQVESFVVSIFFQACQGMWVKPGVISSGEHTNGLRLMPL